MSRESNPGLLCIKQARYPSRHCLSGPIFKLKLFSCRPHLAPASFWLVSASRRRCKGSRPRVFPAVGGCEWLWPELSFAGLTCFYSTNRPTCWTCRSVSPSPSSLHDWRNRDPILRSEGELGEINGEPSVVVGATGPGC